MKDINKEMTEWELEKNIIGLCKDCSDNKQKEWQRKNKGLKIYIGDYVKLPITDKRGREHIWFKVVGKFRNSYIGKCDNVPVVIEKFKCGDITQFKFKEIEEYIKK